MLKRIQENFRRGIERIRWFANVFSERFRIEITIVRLLYQADEMEKKKDELLKSIGKRVYEFKGHTEKSILKDRLVLDAVVEIERIETNMNELKQKVSEIGSVGV
ncbi:MAG: hypothetical protein HZA17_15055 [Nitrospirae bacterium]|nr:hypothetical protein [Nitrospirota bacterium]